MACSQYADVQLEGLIEIANQIQEDDNVKNILSKFDGLIPTIVNVLSSTNNDLLRVSCSCLNSFSYNSDINVQKLIVDSGGIKRLVQLLAKTNTMDNNEIFKLSIKTLYNLSKNFFKCY